MQIELTDNERFVLTAMRSGAQLVLGSGESRSSVEIKSIAKDAKSGVQITVKHYATPEQSLADCAAECYREFNNLNVATF